MSTTEAVIHFSADYPFVNVDGGSGYQARARWALDLALLGPISAPPGTFYYENPAQHISVAGQSVEFDLLVASWDAIRTTERNLYCVVDYRLDSDTSGIWTVFSTTHFRINHDPAAIATNTSVFQIDASDALASDAVLDGSTSDDPDLHASVNPDPGPLNFRWSLIKGPPMLQASSALSAAAASIAPTATPVVAPAGTPVLPEEEGFYQFQLEIIDNDVATIGKTKGSAGSATTMAYAIFGGEALVGVYADAFIPQPWVYNPDPLPVTIAAAYAGDDRLTSTGTAFFTKYGSARLWTQSVISLTSDPPMVQTSHDTGISKAYYMSRRPVPFGDDPSRYIDWDRYRVGKGTTNDCWERAYKLLPAKPKLVNTRRPGSVLLKIFGASQIPFDPLAPRITYSYDLTFFRSGDQVMFDVVGEHSAFPSHELYVGDTLVHAHDSTKHSPYGLLRSVPFQLTGLSLPSSAALGTLAWRPGT